MELMLNYRRQARIGVLAIAILGLTVQRGSAFTVSIHRIITTNSLKTITVVLGGELRTFSDQALNEVANANAAVDALLSAALLHPERHFTNERFSESSTRLVEYKN